jgi:hypothetical protein
MWAFDMCKRPSSIRPSVSFSHLTLLLWHHWTDFNQSCHSCSLDGSLPDLWFWCWIEIQNGCQGDWVSLSISNCIMQVPKLSFNCLIRISFHVCHQHHISINIRGHQAQLVIIKLHDVNIIIFAVNYLTLSATMTNQIKVFVTV